MGAYLIVFDSSCVYGTPSYYNQMLFANNRPDVILPLDLQLPQGVDQKARKPLYAVAGKRNNEGEVIVKVVNISGQAQDSAIRLNGAPARMSATATVLTSAQPSDENSFDFPTRVALKDVDLGQISFPFNYTFAPYSVTALHLKAN